MYKHARMRLLKHKIPVIAFFALLVSGAATAQPNLEIDPFHTEEGKLLRPRIHAMAGPLTYFGDVGTLNGTGHTRPLNWGYGFGLETPISPYFSLNAFMRFGKIGAEENLPLGNANFETSIGMGGLGVSYNFGHLMDTRHSVRPYVSLGISTFEFNPKADLYDANGNRYHYWSDGTIRDRSESTPLKSEAQILQRDYTYETDLRKSNDGVHYALRSVSIPMGIGVQMRVNDRFDFRMGTEFHYVFTDNLDNISSETGYNKPKNSRDHLMFSSVGLAYNLHVGKTRKDQNQGILDPSDFPDFEDEDGDGIVDFLDYCPFTPAGVAVDERGCPVDSDGDGVPDHLDKEPATPQGSYVDADGVALNDADFENMYLMYMDSTGSLQYDKARITTDDVSRNHIVLRDRSQGYRVEIGSSGNLSPDEISKLLSIADLKSQGEGSESIFYLGDFEELGTAISHAEVMADLGFTPTIMHHKFGQNTSVDVTEISSAAAEFAALTQDPNEVLFRVQIGAYRYALSNNVFKDIPNLLIVKGNDGLTRYVSGSFQTLQAAAEYKVDLLLNGYEGAFVTAYRGGKRITLREAGARMAENVTEEINESKQTPSINAEFVDFTVRLGTFDGRVPAKTLGEFMNLGGVRPMKQDNGSTTYVFGKFETLEAANAEVKRLKESGFENAEAVGLFNSSIISADEADRIKNGR